MLNIKTIPSIVKRPIRWIMLIVLFTGSFSAYSQQEPMYSQYMFNMMHINPAYAGNWAMDNVTLLSRRQWLDVKGSPFTFTLAWDSRRDQSSVGYGLQMYSDRLGIESTTGVQGFYSYRISFTNSYLTFGVSGGLLYYRADFSEVNTFRPGDPVFAENVKSVLPSAGIGVIYASEKWYAGLSVPALLKTKVGLDYQVIKTSAKNHFFFTGGYLFDMSDKIKLKPSFMLKAVSGASFQYDLNLNTWIDDVIGLGVSYRTKDALVGMFEIQIAPVFRIGYAYDYTLSRVNNFSKGTHELMLRYEFSRGRKQRVLSPRYF